MARLISRARAAAAAAAAPRPAATKELQGLLGDPVVQGFFFSRVGSRVDWLEPLAEAGLFSRPPEPERRGERIITPRWPASAYLARVASKAPEAAMHVALEVPDTGNLPVHRDLADVAATDGVPPELAARWAAHEADWVRGQAGLYLGLGMKLGELAERLAKVGEADAAFDLAEALLGLRAPGPSGGGEERARTPTSEPLTRLDQWEYKQVLGRLAGPLAAADGGRALGLVCDLLAQAIRISRRGDAPPREDLSYIWRPAVEDSEQNLEFGIKPVLVTALRDLAGSLVREGHLGVAVAVRALGDRREEGWIFERIALHLLRLFPDRALVAGRLTDRRLFEEVGVRHEYSLLLGTGFDRLSQGDKEKILAWVDEGPAEHDVLRERLARFKGVEGEAVSDQEVENARLAWQRDRLYPIRDFLEGEWKELYERASGELGRPEHPEFPVYVRGGAVPSSEVGFGAGDDPLVRDLADRFAVLAAGGEGVDWEERLAACAKEARREGDEGAREARRNDLIVIARGLDGDAKIPFALREQVWAALEPLTHDPDPTPEAEEKALGGADGRPARAGARADGTDVFNYSINTVRGEAMHTVVRYARWVNSNLARRAGAAPGFGAGLEAMPEARRVLDDHLDPATEPSAAVRCAYGRGLPWLRQVDPDWARGAVPLIFPADPSQAHLRDAAWQAYLMSWPAYDSMYELLRGEYSRALAELGGGDRDSSLDEPLARHILALYWRGRLEGGELDWFYRSARPQLRAYAMNFVGSSLGREKGVVPDAVLDRLTGLWESRLEAASSAAGAAREEHEPEVAEFGWWFLSGKFHADWALGQLEAALRASNQIRPEYQVVQRLAELRAGAPGQAARCLALIAKGLAPEDGTPAWRDEARRVVEGALAGDPGTRDAGLDAADELFRLGCFEFYDLAERYLGAE